MKYYAKVNTTKIVEQVMVAEESFFPSFIDSTPGEWVEVDEGVSIGYIYEPQLNIFHPPQPYPSWVLDEETCLWEPPTPYPEDDNSYNWNEDNQTWEQVNE